MAEVFVSYSRVNRDRIVTVSDALEESGFSVWWDRSLKPGDDYAILIEEQITASKAVVVGFNVRANVQAKTAADQGGVEIRYYNIIYDLVDDVKAAMSGLLSPMVREIFLGNARILEVFNISKVGKVAGCRVNEGRVERGAKVRLIRDNVVIHEGTLSTLKRFKDEVREVPAGQECGMAFANYQDIREGDVIECFNVETIQRTL